MRKKFYHSSILALTAMLTAGSVAACGGGGSSKYATETMAAAYDTYGTGAGYDTAYNAYAVAETAASFPGAMMDGDYDSGNYRNEYGILEEDAVAEPMEAPMALSGQTTMAQEYPDSASVPSASPSAIKRKLIRTVGLDVETTDFDNLLTAIQNTVTDKGGYVEQSDISGTSMSAFPDQRRYAYMTVRIPSNELDLFLSQMAQQSNVISRSENVQDVTLQYTDIESRKKSLTIEQERLWDLLEKADTLEAVIALEARLSEIRYQLESFESQLRTYDNQVDYSTVHISIQEVGVFTPTVPDSVGTRIQKGFIRNLENVSRDITDFIVWFLSHIPSIILLGIVLGIIAAIVKGIVKKAKKNQTKTAPAKNQGFPSFRKHKKTSVPDSPSYDNTTEENASDPKI